ncbi:L,D-transpeptidase [Candidatus Uhrbacteria bacterium]|nr:L,D-transpeptidase [Candidatus Uhrbacteria bacterium]
MKIGILLVLMVSLLVPHHATWAAHPSSITVGSLDESIEFPFTGDAIGGISLSLADLGTDGISEIIIGNGLGLEPRVHILRQDGSEIKSFLAYAATLGTGINVSTCDLTGDGHNEIITAPQRGGGPHIRIFNRYGEAIDAGGFFAYEEAMRAGVNITCGDLVGDERAELVTLPAAGAGPHVRIWSWNDEPTLIQNFFAFDQDDRSGVAGTISEKKLILAQQQSETPKIKTMVIHTSPEVISEKKYSINGLGIHSLTSYKKNIYASLVSGPVLNITRNEVQPLSESGTTLSLASDETRLLFAPGRLLFSSYTEPKRIEVDISQQRLYAFEQGVLRNSFLISSGLNNATPLGNHQVLAKIPLVHYAWFYGSGSPYNYDLGWVPYNLRFFPHIYIHYAPWHQNFGHPMSHGCVNVGYANMEWIYNWAEETIPLVVKE